MKHATLSLFSGARRAMPACLIVLLSACGGGGGGGSEPAPAPVENVGTGSGLATGTNGGDQTAPTNPTPPPASNATPMVAAGDGFSLALTADGTVMAWGDQENGTLGNGVDRARSTRVPTPVLGLTNIRQIAAGPAHAMALRSDGVVFVWGANGFGRLGLGRDGGAEPTPVQVAGLSNIVAIAAGGAHSLALRADGAVFAWGDNFVGQLGLSDAEQRDAPSRITTLSNVVAIAAGGQHSLAVRDDGSVWAWGSNADGQLGIGDTEPRLVPTPIASLAGQAIEQVAAGRFHSLARSANGAVFSWGASNRGQSGREAATVDGFGQFLIPGLIAELTGVAAIAAGDEHSLARLADGSLLSWGHAGDGRLGNGTAGITQSSFRAQQVQAPTVTAIAAGKSHSLLIDAAGRVGCFGSNFFSQCGRVEGSEFDIPVEVGPGLNVAK